VLADHVTGRGGGRDDDVGLAHALEELVVRDRGALELVGQLDRALVGAVGDEHRAHALADQVLRRQLAHLAGTDHEDRAPLERVEDLLRKLDGGVADRHGALADGRLGADALPDLERLTEHPVEEALGGARLAGEVVGLLHLMEDLGLAHDHRVERGDHPEQVLHDRVALDDVEVARQLVTIEVVEVAQEVDDRVRAGLGGRHRVDLGAVAGREDDRLGYLVGPGERRQRLRLDVSREGELLADLDRRGLMRKTDEGQVHTVGVLPSRSRCPDRPDIGQRVAPAGAMRVVQASDARRGRCRPR